MTLGQKKTLRFGTVAVENGLNKQLLDEAEHDIKNYRADVIKS